MKDSTGTDGDTEEEEIVWALVNFTFENPEDQDEKRLRWRSLSSNGAWRVAMR